MIFTHLLKSLTFIPAAIYSTNTCCTVTPFKFAAIKVRGFEILTYSRPFNFAVSYQNYFTVSYTNVVFSYTQIKVGTLYVKDHQVLRLEHRLGLMEILENLKRYIFLQKLPKKKVYSRPFNFANLGHSRISRN